MINLHAVKLFKAENKRRYFNIPLFIKRAKNDKKVANVTKTHPKAIKGCTVFRKSKEENIINTIINNTYLSVKICYSPGKVEGLQSWQLYRVLKFFTRLHSDHSPNLTCIPSMET